MNLKNRLHQLETQQRAQDENLAARIAWVIGNPTEAAAAIGAQAVARVKELIAIARARKEASHG